MSNPHTVKIVETDAGLKAVFTCSADRDSDCHFYPDCDCEYIPPDHQHPKVKNDLCWMSDWFEVGAISPANDDIQAGDMAEAGYSAGMSGPIGVIGDPDYLEWYFLDEEAAKP